MSNIKPDPEQMPAELEIEFKAILNSFRDRFAQEAAQHQVNAKPLSLGRAVNYVSTSIDHNVEIRIKSGEVSIHFAGAAFEADGMDDKELSEMIVSASWLAGQQLVSPADNGGQ